MGRLPESFHHGCTQTQVYQRNRQNYHLGHVILHAKQLQSIPHDEIVQNCDKFYHDEEYVWQQKEFFFSAIDKAPKKSRTGDKKVKDLNDILTEMKARDASGEWQPVCVAIAYNNFTHSNDGSISNSQQHGTLLNVRKEFVTRDYIKSFKTEIMSAFRLMSNMISRPVYPMSSYSSPSRRFMPTPNCDLYAGLPPQRLNLSGEQRVEDVGPGAVSANSFPGLLSTSSSASSYLASLTASSFPKTSSASLLASPLITFFSNLPNCRCHAPAF